MGTSKRYSEEVRERAVRMVAEHLHEYSSQWAAITSIAAKIGVRLSRCVAGYMARSAILASDRA